MPYHNNVLVAQVPYPDLAKTSAEARPDLEPVTLDFVLPLMIAAILGGLFFFGFVLKRLQVTRATVNALVGLGVFVATCLLVISFFVVLFRTASH